MENSMAPSNYLSSVDLFVTFRDHIVSWVKCASLMFVLILYFMTKIGRPHLIFSVWHLNDGCDIQVPIRKRDKHKVNGKPSEKCLFIHISTRHSLQSRISFGHGKLSIFDCWFLFHHFPMLFPPVSDVLWMLMRASEKPDSGGSDSLLYFVRILFFLQRLEWQLLMI